MMQMQPLFGLLALFLVLSVVHPCTSVAARETVVVFKSGATEVSYKGDNNVAAVRKPREFRFPTLVGGVIKKKEFLAVLSSASLTESSGYGFDGVARTRYGDHKQWSKAEVFTHKDQNNKKHIHEEAFTTVMKENKMYALAFSIGIQGTQQQARFADNWDILLFVGTVKDSSGSAAGGPSITWEAGKSLKTTLVTNLKTAQATYFVGAAGNGIVTKSGAIVFPIRMSQPNNTHASSILYSIDNGATWKFGEKTALDTHGGSVVEWGDGKLLLNVLSGSGYYQAFESGDMGTTWKESLVFSRVWGFDPQRKERGCAGSVIKVPVDEKDVLLFAHPVNKKGGHTSDTLQLWVSDGQRIVRVGTISDKDNEHDSGSSILAHVGDHLYITHEINPLGSLDSSTAELGKWDGVIGFTSLPEFFESAKTTVRAWRQLDTKYKTAGVPTEGLVGFLGNAKKDNSVWEDKYKCVDATVKGGKSVNGGFRFDATSGSGAQWPVVSQGQNQFYIFAEKQFTLAATVMIHAAKVKGQFALLGASLDSSGNNVLFAIGYTDDNKWYTESNDNKKITTTHVFESEKEYHVALTFLNGVCSAYVNGVAIEKKELKDQQTASISHFFMGGSGKSSSTEKSSSCTVKNVMLFNRALEAKEVDELTKVSNENKLNEKTTPEDSPVKPEKGEAVKTAVSKEENVIIQQNITNDKRKNNNEKNSLHEIRDVAYKNHAGIINGAVLSFCAVALMCIVSFCAV